MLIFRHHCYQSRTLDVLYSKEQFQAVILAGQWNHLTSKPYFLLQFSNRVNFTKETVELGYIKQLSDLLLSCPIAA